MNKYIETIERTCGEFNAIRVNGNTFATRRQALRAFARYSAAFCAFWRAARDRALGGDKFQCAANMAYYRAQARNAMADARVGLFERWGV